jgi:hypothetical protein
MKSPNAYPAARLTSTERRRELCAILARGLIRLQMRARPQLNDDSGENLLHSCPEKSGSPDATHRRILC